MDSQETFVLDFGAFSFSVDVRSPRMTFSMPDPRPIFLGNSRERETCNRPSAGRTSAQIAVDCPAADCLREISASGKSGEMSSPLTENQVPSTRMSTIPAGPGFPSVPIETHRNTNSEPQECKSSSNRTGLCPPNVPRSDLTVESSRRSTFRQTKDFELTRSGPFSKVRRTLRFSRFDSRRKVFSENEKRNAHQRSSTRRMPDRHC